MGNRRSQTTRTQLWGCEIRAVFPGYSSGAVSLAGRDFSAPLTLSPIVLRRNGAGISSSVSAIGLQAPENAKKEYEKGLENFSKKKFGDADKHLAKAIELYPKYASAMCVRGKAQRALHLDDQARESFLSAISSDERYVPSYLNLAALDASRAQWLEVIALSTKAIAIDPLSYPDAYYFKAVAHIALTEISDAKKDIVKVIEMDKERRFPRAELMLGNILRTEGDHVHAAEYLHAYIQHEPSGPEVPKIKAYLQKSEEKNPQSKAVPKPQ